MTGFELPDGTIARLSGATGLAAGYVRDVMRDVRFVIDTFVAADINVLLAPLNLIRRGNPVIPAMMEHFRLEDWQNPEGLKTAPPDRLARALQLSVAEVEDHPCVFGTQVLDAVCDWRDVPVGDLDEFRRIAGVVSAWRDDMEERGVSYRVSTAGRESCFENWLVENLRVLESVGVHVELLARQPRLANGRRIPELVCRPTAPLGELRAGDLLVIENKTTPVGLPALAQVDEYADLVKDEMTRPGQRVGAMLIADGTTVELQDALADAGVGYESLVALGYRDHLYRTGRLSRELDVAEGTAISLEDPAEVTLPGELRKGPGEPLA